MNSTSACGHAPFISLAHSLVTFLGVVTSTGSAEGPSSSGAITLFVRTCRYAMTCPLCSSQTGSTPKQRACGWVGQPGTS